MRTHTQKGTGKTDYLPAAEGTREVPVRQLALQRGGPALTVGGVAAVDDGPVKPVNVSRGSGLRRVGHTTAGVDGLSGELGLVEPELACGHEVECRLAVGRLGRSATCYGRRQALERLEDDVLVRRPCVGSIPKTM